MDCHGVRENINAYIDGELSQVEARLIESHLAACNSCRHEHDAYELTRAFVVSNGPMPSPPGLSESIRVMMEKERLIPKRRVMPFRRPSNTLLAASLAVALVAGAVSLKIISFNAPQSQRDALITSEIPEAISLKKAGPKTMTAKVAKVIVTPAPEQAEALPREEFDAAAPAAAAREKSVAPSHVAAAVNDTSAGLKRDEQPRAADKPAVPRKEAAAARADSPRAVAIITTEAKPAPPAERTPARRVITTTRTASAPARAGSGRASRDIMVVADAVPATRGASPMPPAVPRPSPVFKLPVPMSSSMGGVSPHELVSYTTVSSMDTYAGAMATSAPADKGYSLSASYASVAKDKKAETAKKSAAKPALKMTVKVKSKNPAQAREAALKNIAPGSGAVVKDGKIIFSQPAGATLTNLKTIKAGTAGQAKMSVPEAMLSNEARDPEPRTVETEVIFVADED